MTNNADELERFKMLNLGELAAFYGYQLDRKDSSRSNLVMRHADGDKIIIATDADTEGEMTALYLSKLIKPLGVHLSRIGLGLPVGSNLEYADATTLSKSLESRRTL